MDERLETSVPVCYRHPNRVTGLACTRCGRPICVECSHDAAVGQLCPECARPQGRHRVVSARRVFGRPTFQTAPVSFTLLVATTSVFLLGTLAPSLGNVFFGWFAQANWLIAAGEWWRIFTAALLHGGIAHIFFNMYALYLFGPRLEQRVGSPAFAALYVAAAGAGGAASYAFGPPQQVSIGASGAIFGLFGAWLFAAWLLREHGGRRMFNELVVLLVINLALPLLIPGIDWRAHVGGLLAGLVIASLWSKLAVGRANAIGLRSAIAAAVVVLDLVVVLLR